MVMTHLANVTDRIDRSYSPRGGREERELDVLSSKIAKDRRGIVPLQRVLEKSRTPARFIAGREPLSPRACL